jgi:biotin transporter BioY
VERHPVPSNFKWLGVAMLAYGVLRWFGGVGSRGGHVLPWWFVPVIAGLVVMSARNRPSGERLALIVVSAASVLGTIALRLGTDFDAVVVALAGGFLLFLAFRPAMVERWGSR